MIPISPTNQVATSKIDLAGTQSNEDLIEALKSELLDEFMLYIKLFRKEELKFSKQENDLANSNTEIIKSFQISKTRACQQK